MYRYGLMSKQSNTIRLSGPMLQVVVLQSTLSVDETKQAERISWEWRCVTNRREKYDC